jgi:hypothetical protein
MHDEDDRDLTHGHPATLTHAQKHVMRQAATNQALRQCLSEGATILSTYHAQLGVDRLRQTDELATLEQQLELLKTEEAHLDDRIEFLFHDCKRLEADNAVIMSGFGAKDASTEDVKRLLRLEGEKLRDVSSKTSAVQGEVLANSKKLVELKGDLRSAKRSKIDKRNAEWDTQDDVDRLQEAITMAKGEMQHLERCLEAARVAAAQKRLEEEERRRKLPKGPGMVSTVPSPLGSQPILTTSAGTMSTLTARSTVSGNSVLRSTPMLVDRPVRQERGAESPPPSSMQRSHGQAERNNPSTLVCKRPDCVAVALKLEELSR